MPELSLNQILHFPVNASPRSLQGSLSNRHTADVTITIAISNGVLVAVSPVGDLLQFPIQGMLSTATSDYLS